VCVSVDLLERGRTTGQAARLLYDPPRREKLEAEAAKAKEAEEQSKMKKTGGKGKDAAAGKDGTATKTTNKAKAPEPVQSPGIPPDDDEEEEEEEEMEDAVVPSRYWYSLVCYGLPNLAVATQPGKN